LTGGEPAGGLDFPMTQTNLESELQRWFGHAAFRPGQREIVEALLAGRSALAVLPTGGGKSICYQLPAVILEGTALVVSPLIALMKDQVDALKARGIAAERLDSTLDASEFARIHGDISSGALKLLYVAPERFLSESFLAAIRRAKISLLAIDEAHCISEWGHNFRPEYLRLAAMAKKLRIPRVLALTATATPEVAKEIRQGFRIAKGDHFQTSFRRENLFLSVTPVRPQDRMPALLDGLKTPGRFPAVVYVTLQHTAESVAAELVKNGIRARAYHAGMAGEVRASAQDDFMAGRCEVIVATIAFGMGIDKSDIRSVFHYNLPKTLENYQQEIGRAGRDGRPSHCEMLACANDLVVLQNFIHGDVPEEQALRHLVDHLLRRGAEFDISRYDLSRTTDIRPLVLETVITRLEQEGLLDPCGMFHSTMRVAFRHPEDRVIAGHTPQRQKFLKALFASGKRGTRLLTIDLDAASKTTGESRERILKALNWLEESGDIELQRAGLRHRFRLLPKAAERTPREVADSLHTLFTSRAGRDLERLQSIVDFAEHPGCLVRRLLDWFGEKLDSDCGHCSRCAREKPAALPRGVPAEISRADLAAIDALRREDHAALRGKRALARFLCGISSPATTRDRLSRHDDFGRLESIPFETVLAQLDASL
jgi:ATP-dependent DNA helicase RecQ